MRRIFRPLCLIVVFAALAGCVAQAASPSPTQTPAPTDAPPTDTPPPTATPSVPTLPAIPQPTFQQPTFTPGPTFTPSPGQLAFVSDASGHDQLYLMNSDGSDSRPLTDDSHDNRDPAWSPDGTRMAFTRLMGLQEEMAGPNGMVLRSVESAEIVVMNADGSNPVSLTHALAEKGLAAFNPVWSPDGRTIAFEAADVTWVGDQFAGWNIYVADASGSGEMQRLTAWEAGRGVGCTGPAWLPDSQRLLTYCRSLMQAGLVLYGLDGENGLLILEGQGARFYGASPSGVLAVSEGTYLVTLGGSDFSESVRIPLELPVVPPTGYIGSILALAWSPIAAGPLAVRTGYNLAVANADGLQVGELAGGLPTDETFAALSWSPDGSQLVFVATLDGNREIMLAALDQQGDAYGKRVRPLAEKLGSDFVRDCDVTSEASLDGL